MDIDDIHYIDLQDSCFDDICQDLDDKYGELGGDDEIERMLGFSYGSEMIRKYIEHRKTIEASVHYINKYIDLIHEGAYSKLTLPEQNSFKLKFSKNFSKISPSLLTGEYDFHHQLKAVCYTKLPSDLVNTIDCLCEYYQITNSTYYLICEYLHNTSNGNEKLPDKISELDIHFLERDMKVDVKHASVPQGCLYIMSNLSLPGILKIGFTAGDPADRAKRIDSKLKLDNKFVVEKFYDIKYPYIVEQNVHARIQESLIEYKLLKIYGTEYFRITLKESMSVIEEEMSRNNDCVD